MKAIITLVLLAAAAVGQASRSVTLTWEDSQTGVTYNVYRANGPCTGTPAFMRLASGIVPRTYVDSGMAIGDYCYVVTATANNKESRYSPTALAAVDPKAPTSLTVVVNVTVTVSAVAPQQ